ncbi:MAG: hypothetical protein IRY85_19785 [Micromonosporaceae bacterium]|nr:hypothetical protein [Micromonosporaceae bacterium]
MHEIRIPKVGMSTVEVDVTDLHVQIGQRVEVGDPIADIDTDKVTTTITADAAGTVTTIAVTAGQTYAVGDVICVLE